MSLAPGRKIGVFEILGSLGTGGMGEVYRARDTKLNRDVAIKVLLPAVANDPDRLARFSREAQVLASLNHPNIAAIYGLERQEGREGQEGRDPTATAFIVMEFVDGAELAQRVTRGPIPLDEALPIARQIAEALEAAHEQGALATAAAVVLPGPWSLAVAAHTCLSVSCGTRDRSFPDRLALPRAGC